MGGAASLIPGGAASLIPEQIDIDSFRTLSGDKFIQEVFDSFKDEKGFISQSLLLDLNSVNSRLPRFKEAIAIYRKLFFNGLFVFIYMCVLLLAHREKQHAAHHGV